MNPENLQGVDPKTLTLEQAYQIKSGILERIISLKDEYAIQQQNLTLVTAQIKSLETKTAEPVKVPEVVPEA